MYGIESPPSPSLKSTCRICVRLSANHRAIYLEARTNFVRTHGHMVITATHYSNCYSPRFPVLGKNRQVHFLLRRFLSVDGFVDDDSSYRSPRARRYCHTLQMNFV